MSYVRIALSLSWLLISCGIGLVLCVVRWGHPNLDRDFARVFSWGVLRIAGVRVATEGLEHLTAAQPCIYVANHQSGFDMATFGAIYPTRTIVIGKKELKWIPLFGLFFVAAGNIMIDRQRRTKAIAGLGQAVEAIRERGSSIWIFPEGTRNRTRELLQPFKKGAFYMAIEAGVPIVPIVSAPLEPVLNWRRKKVNGGTLRLRVLPPVPTKGFRSKDVDPLADRVRGMMMEALRGLGDHP
jgi:1-acyl-sn-glycerol-3-phosphate acyltransferase